MKEIVLVEIPPKPPKMKKSIAIAHIPTLRNNPAKFHNKPMYSLGGVADNRFQIDRRTDRGNLVCPVSLKAGHKNDLIKLQKPYLIDAYMSPISSKSVQRFGRSQKCVLQRSFINLNHIVHSYPILTA